MLKNQRLQFLLQFLNPNLTIADIGTDHGYLPIAYIKENNGKLAYAVDVNQKPLNQAIKNIDFYNLNEKVIPVLSDGLDYFLKNKIKLDYVVVAGLGSSTIKIILEQDSYLFDNYLICCNTDPLIIREYIKQQQWFILHDDFFVENDKNYWIIIISKTKGTKISNNQELFLTTNKKMFENKNYLNYLKKLYLTQTKILSFNHEESKKNLLKNYNNEIEKVI